MISERLIRLRIIDINNKIHNLESGNCTLAERSNKELLIASYSKEIKTLNWVLGNSVEPNN